MKTTIERTEKGHILKFRILNQEFSLKEFLDEDFNDDDEWDSKEYAKWYEDNLNTAFVNMLVDFYKSTFKSIDGVSVIEEAIRKQAYYYVNGVNIALRKNSIK